MPNLLEVQIKSFEDFLQMDAKPQERRKRGLEAVFQEIFPIEDTHRNFSLEYLGYSLGEPQYTVEECKERDMTYNAPLKAFIRLVKFETVDGERRVKEIVEPPDGVYLGEIPLITPTGTFLINGAERVIVSQLHRSPGVFFDEVIHPNGKKLFGARIIPYRGSWLEFSLDVNDIMYAHIDRKRKLPVSILLRAIGYDTNEEILGVFYRSREVKLDKKSLANLEGKISCETIPDQESGEVMLEAGETITEELTEKLEATGIKSLRVLAIDLSRDAAVICNTLAKDPTRSREKALYKIYSLLRPGDAPNIETAEALLERLFFNPKRYDLGAVGRYRLNQRLDLSVSGDVTNLDKEDFTAIIDYLLSLRNGDRNCFVDDIDHLGNRRARSVGELLANQLSVGLSRMARTVRERMSLQDVETMTPYDLINARTISAVITAFFGSSQLSQFMDQTNPLAEMTHKRRLSALGPGGLTRERAGFEVRDVHHTHYGRMCPIETPEGPNIGLISSLSTFARINEFGFIETPYRKVEKGVVTNKIEYLTADVEDKYIIAQANAPLTKDSKFALPTVKARHRGDFIVVDRKVVDFMDVSPAQLVSVAASLIPFLEHDDANRALMGSNMQRQAVPLLKPESPIVGTGMESKVARDSGAVLVANYTGVVERASAEEVIILRESKGKGDKAIAQAYEVDIFRLAKFRRSNQDTCINQKPLVKRGDKLKAGQVIADGAATNQGELALGINSLVAFMPWSGYNFEDAILISERLAKEDKLTSVHVEEFELKVRDTKRGPEEITREIPNLSEESLRNLDDEGIIRVGAEVEPGDILVGKVTPTGKTELSPEERLLRAIFGEKAGDVRDSSLKAPPGISGIVIDVKILSRYNHDEAGRKEEKLKLKRLQKDAKEKIERVRLVRDRKLVELLTGEKARDIHHKETMESLVKEGKKLTEAVLTKMDFNLIDQSGDYIESSDKNREIHMVLQVCEKNIAAAEEILEKEKEKISQGDELPPGILKLVKVYIASKRKIAVGDKMAGRHGNKGVIARVLPEEDMPYLPDGTPVEIVLNPLGVPSRMNVGQILEAHLGWAAKVLGFKIATPVFDGAGLEEIRSTLKEADLPESGKTVLYDGRSGEPFADEITVGYIYMMKLSHLVDDKIHARSIGPYSLVTQQPLGGKAQFGGQRFGEMDVWALEAPVPDLRGDCQGRQSSRAGNTGVFQCPGQGAAKPRPRRHSREQVMDSICLICPAVRCPDKMGD
jgi:DNA-directed RNA polymerase subunit beta